MLPEAPRKCRRHDWFATVLDANGKVINVADPGPLPHREGMKCRNCPAIRDEAVKRRNRANRARGANFERSVAKVLGGRRTGPLGGRDDVVVGNTIAVQTKKDMSLSLNKARTYLADLSRTFPGRTALVIHARPGRDAQPVVILSLNDWLALHGQDGMEEPAA